MWKLLLQMLGRLVRSSRNKGAQPRPATPRDRFWEELREGQREAEARTRS
jgi:hypothetical protein